MKLHVQYSPQFEVNRVQETIDQWEWFQKNGYKVSLPKGIDASKLPVINIVDIKKAVDDEYNIDDYAKHEKYLNDKWDNVMSELNTELNKTDLKSLEVYEIFLTKYGVGGSYHYPDQIIANITFKYEKGLMRTIVHELIHLVIQPLIEKYKINHWSKERIVDLLITRLTPTLAKSQNLPIETESIDKIFENNYPNIQLIISLVGKKVRI